MTFTTTFRPTGLVGAVAYDATAVIAGSLAVALSAQIVVPLPFTPVPVTGQTLAVLLTGFLLGSRLGAMTLIAYLAEGVAGLPVFAAGGAGPAHLFGPTGGYLAGFVVAAYVAGLLAERGWTSTPARTALGMTIGTSLILVCGASWLAFYVGPEAAITMGVLPFLIGGAAKIALATVALPAIARLIRR
jgi:biotin transport system substrate-specific component